MLIVEHRLKSVESCQSLVAEVVGPSPATHLFLCSGYIQVDASRIVEQSGLINTLPDAPLPLSFLLPDNDRQFLTLTARDGTPLTILSSTASATFPFIDLSQNATPVRREIKGVQVHYHQKKMTRVPSARALRGPHDHPGHAHQTHSQRRCIRFWFAISLE